ncbi:LytR C-terminal domain-containing protein [Georgenia sp. TF02-10]|uniref:LytR C-terminal domain-containing protein n=1 Tax=Georgenia sp. TF02-10 TaxID=2917725 RepID=UPI001FA7AEC8|nr:LytR C-terminal domain-containing protein [Georgenia sp. TF02-10]UNX55290.1 LytR C-terminal domain-containing protein [Georgenia sp. TF02-10]
MTTQPPQDYPEDEFDVAGRDRVPQGVHRAPRPLRRTLLPVLAVVVLAPLLAWGAVSLLGGGGSPGTSASPTAQATDDAATEVPTEEPPAGEETPEPGESPTGEETTPAEETPSDVAYDTAIAVLNGSGVTGLAGDAVGQLAAAGFTGGIADDYAGGAPTTTTLYYNNADLAPTAQEVASVLGIDTVVESADATSAIAIVLRADYAG